MSLRTFSVFCLAALAASCTTESPAPDGETIDCAIGPGAAYSSVCTLEGVGESEFLVHSPNGGFRRLKLDPSTGEFGAVDGADRLTMLVQDGEIAEFEIGGDRYRIPHTAVAAALE